MVGVDYPGSTDDAVMADNATVTAAASSAHTVHSVFISTGSTLAQGANSTLTLSGIWLNTGTYTPGINATVVLNGTTQAILGNGTTFANLTKISSVSDVLKLTTTTVVSGLLTLKGVAGNLLSLVSAAFTPPTWLSEFIISTAGVDYPSGIAIDSAGNQYISNCGTTPGIYKYDPSGTYLSSFGVGTLSCPYGVSVDPAGNVYVSDYAYPESNAFVYKYAPNGTQTARWGSDGLGGTLPIGDPVGIVYDNGHVFVSNSYSGTGFNTGIYEFDANGTYIKLIGNTELENNTPEFLAADSQHNLYVATYRDDRVYKYSSAGTFISSFKVGVNGETFGADTIAIAPNGFIYVGRSDYPTYASKIHVFDPIGNFVTTFGSAGTDHSQFSFYDPVMTFDAAGNFYTVDNKADYRVQKFSVPTSMTVTPWNISANSTDFSFLSVANSVASTIFHCLSGCTDGGGNTNWDFGSVAPTTAPPPPHRSSSRSHVSSTSGGGTSSAGGVQGTPAPTTTDSPAAIKASLQAVTTVSRNLVYGTVSNDVLLLQKFLNAYGFPVAASGVGSSGHETKFFGTLTKVAVKKFQQSVALPVTGFFGPLTRQMISTIRP